jgi:hypothetical protein
MSNSSTTPVLEDTELFELCKEVVQRTEWGGTDYFYCSGNLTHRSQMDDDDFEGEVIPLYTSDYLLPLIPRGGGVIRTSYRRKSQAFIAHGGGNNAYADTPLKALLKLVIALDDAGVKL